MTFLPILERELRLRARSRANYWGRFGIGLLGASIGLTPLVWSGGFGAPAAIGRGVFTGVVCAAFVLSCAACLVTADSVSAERRDGTLGLLFLTRVKYLDVLLGKIASNGLTCVFALVTFLPVLMFPVLAGGVTGGEVVRNGLVLIEALFLALSAGLWASARGYERFRTARTAVLLVATLVLIPSVLGLLLPGTSIELASPLGAMLHAADSPYKLSPARYWLSLGLVQAVGWALLFTAAVNLRARLRSGEDGTTSRFLPGWLNPRRSEAPQVTGAPEGGSPASAEILPHKLASAATRPPKNPRPDRSSPESTPLHWLLRRERGMKAIVWSAALVSVLQYAFYGVVGRFWSPGTYLGVLSSLALVMAGISGSLLAWAASRFFVEARRNGELELLLTTPLGVEAIVSTQWDVLKRLLRWPVVVMLSPMLLQGVVILLQFTPTTGLGWGFYYAGSILLNAINSVFGLGAVCWLGMWFGLRTGGQARTILWAVGLGRGVPYALEMSCSLLSRMLFPMHGQSAPWVYWILSLGPRVLTLSLYIWLIILAESQALQELRGAQPVGLRQIITSAAAAGADAIRQARRWPN